MMLSLLRDLPSRMENNASLAIDISEALTKAGGNRDLAGELLGMLLRDFPGFQQRMNQAFSAGEMETLQQVVHKLHGATTYCGVPRLRAACLTLESHLKRGITDNLDSELQQVLFEMAQVEESSHLLSKN